MFRSFIKSIMAIALVGMVSQVEAGYVDSFKAASGLAVNAVCSAVKIYPKTIAATAAVLGTASLTAYAIKKCLDKYSSNVEEIVSNSNSTNQNPSGAGKVGTRVPKQSEQPKKSSVFAQYVPSLKTVATVATLGAVVGLGYHCRESLQSFCSTALGKVSKFNLGQYFGKKAA